MRPSDRLGLKGPSFLFLFLIMAEPGPPTPQVTELLHYILRMADAATPAATASVRAASVISGYERYGWVEGLGDGRSRISVRF